jgi:hypothetical protein
MNKKTLEAIKRLVKYIKRYSGDEDIKELKDDIIEASDWLADNNK